MTPICPLCDSKKCHEIKMDSCIVYQCNNCTLQYINDKENNIENNYLKNYNESRSEKSTLSKLRQIQYALDAKYLEKNISQGNVLDVGCSTGDFLNILSQNHDLHLFGIDIDEDAISIAKTKCNSEINFFNTDLINYQTNLKFDCIVFRGSFQFLGSDLKETLKKISEISSKNTKILIYSLPNSDSILYYFLKDKWNLFDEFSHTLIFNRTSLMKLCELYGYKIKEYAYPYLETPYANQANDYESLIQLINGEKKDSFPFLGNIIQVVLEK
tara:strand:+ start:60 stop:872 length:813 start_codon:yes stop_codon:yes gene_type:complete